MVPRAGIEPARPLSRGILSPLCLPISPPGQSVLFWKQNRVCRHYENGGGTRSRTEVDGFAIHCIATLLFHQ